MQLGQKKMLYSVMEIHSYSICLLILSIYSCVYLVPTRQSLVSDISGSRNRIYFVLMHSTLLCKNSCTTVLLKLIKFSSFYS